MTVKLTRASITLLGVLASQPVLAQSVVTSSTSEAVGIESIRQAVAVDGLPRSAGAFQKLWRKHGSTAQPAARPLWGLLALASHDSKKAAALLADSSRYAAYLAIAKSRRKGGVAASQSVIAGAIKRGAPEPDVTFLYALGLFRSGEREAAHRFLAQALADSDGVLHHAFAPDPMDALVEALHPFSDPGVASAWSRALERAGYRSAAVTIAEQRLKKAPTEAAQLKLWTRAFSGHDFPEVHRMLDRALAHDPSDPLAPLLRASTMLSQGKAADAKRVMQSVRGVKDEHRPRYLEIRTRIALSEKSPDAVSFAEELRALRPGDSEAYGWYIQALLSVGQLAQAREHVQQLLKRRPTEVNAFDLYFRISTRSKSKGARDLLLRKRSFEVEMKRVSDDLRKRQSVIAAVRRAERNKSAVGLESLRVQYVDTVLPLDLAIARYGTPGERRRARERVLFSCGPRFADFLRRTRPASLYVTRASPYGDAVDIEHPLTASDPGRCGRPTRRAAPR